MNSQITVSVEQMRKSDEYTIKHYTDSKTLMYRAAKGIYESYEWNDKKIAIVCGSGNNGGDGYTLACILADNGIFADIFRVSEKFSDDGRYYHDISTQKNVKSYMFDSATDFSDYDVIVDCILGTGFTGEPRGSVADAIRKINSSDSYVISADINSGLNGDTGKAALAVKSDLTVSIGYLKNGMFKSDAPSLIGKLTNADIGIVLVE